MNPYFPSHLCARLPDVQLVSAVRAEPLDWTCLLHTAHGVYQLLVRNMAEVEVWADDQLFSQGTAEDILQWMREVEQQVLTILLDKI